MNNIRPQSHQRTVKERVYLDSQETNTGRERATWGAAVQTRSRFVSEQRELNVTEFCMLSKENVLVWEGMSSQQNGTDLLTALFR